MWGLPQKQNARRADKIRLCGHLRRYKKIVKKTYIILFKLEIITHDFKFIESINKKYDKDFKITSSGQLNTEISSLSVTKANAIDILCKHFNINLENTYAIGDHLNDLEMLKKVNYSGAVNNAVDDVKKIVNYISTSYDKNGFANFAYHIMK